MRKVMVSISLLCLAAATLLAALTLTQSPLRAAIASPALSTDAGGYYRVANAGSLHLRAGPSTSTPILMSIPEGEILHVQGGPTSGGHYDWYHVTYRGTTGYVAAPWLSYTGLAGTQIASQYSQVVVVSLARQQLEAYDHGTLVLISSVTSGRPALPTPTGTYSVMAKQSPTTFYSPWPEGSPYYYAPTHINYAMLFKSGGFYIHDAAWKPAHGYGTNVVHVGPDGVTRTGSLGCVEMPLWSAQQLYGWVHVGTPVVIVND